jgi:hypothetical protein
LDEVVAGTTQSAAGASSAGESRLDDPFDPIAIANRRPGVWLRYTILAMVRNLIDWADDDFARGLPDTVQRAEERYELARKILGAQALQNDCETIIIDIRNAIETSLGVQRIEARHYTRALLEVRSAAALKQAAKDIETALQGQRAITKQQASPARTVANAGRRDRKKHPSRSPAAEWQRATEKKEAALARAVAKAVSRDRKEHPSQSLAAEWQSKQAEATAFENALFFEGDPGFLLPQPRPPDPQPSGPRRPPFSPFPPDKPSGPRLPTPPTAPPPPPVISLEFCVPLNPVLGLLRQQIDCQLGKLARCLDFLGQPQIPRIYGCDTYDPATGTINRPLATVDQFAYATDQPRYRYAFLVEKARQYVDVAQRFEALLLQALQNSDNEAFQQLKAEQAIELAGATVELRRLGQVEANDAVAVAKAQSQRADSQVQFWNARAGDDINNVWDSLSPAEQGGLVLSATSAGLSAVAILPAAAAAGIGAAITASGVTTTATAALAEIGVPMTAAGFLLTVGGLAGLGAMLPEAASAAGAASNTALTYASFERRFEEWKNQFTLANFDAQIAGLQKTVADDQAAIADQEMVVAQLQLAQAQEELRFLQTKITNLALYDWMVRVLARDYRTLMQIATCVAQLAQRALEFERQQAVNIIVGDYWNVATGVLGAADLTDQQRSLGLMGAEQLLTDLTKLDAFKLATEERRQQITKMISLARMMPTDLAMFRQTGTMTFNTLMEWLDDDFQGHYLRLIKSVKVTIVAIVPPIDGIHAMLHNTGESSVVVTEDGGLTFVKKRATRNFGEHISLDAPFNESGLFVLNYDDPMLLPFEGMGVETQWTLELPRQNNRFDFNTIADVILTIDYTSEYSRDYETLQRAQRAGVDVYEDSAIPLRLQFPDLWYQFKHNRADAAGNFSAFPYTFHLPRTIFALNLKDPIEVAQLTLLVSGNLTSAEQGLVADGLTIRFLRGGSSTAPTRLHTGKVPRPGVPGDASSAFGEPVFGTNSILLSTRGNSANGLPSNPAIGTGDPDAWTIEFSAGLYPDVVNKISDVLFVVTVRGERA